MDSIKENIIEGSIVAKQPTISDVARLAGVSKKYRGMVIVFEDLTQLIKTQKV